MDNNEHPNLALRKFLVASYAYYHLDSTIMSDTGYDSLAQYILKDWELIDHPHKRYVEKYGDLEAGSLFAMPEIEYPEIVKDAAYQMTKVKNPYEITIREYDADGWGIPGTAKPMCGK
jgi:hypothetical protein